MLSIQSTLAGLITITTIIKVSYLSLPPALSSPPAHSYLVSFTLFGSFIRVEVGTLPGLLGGSS